MIDQPPPTTKLQALLRLGQLLRARQYRFVTGTPATHGIVNARPANREAHDLAGVFGWNRPFRQTVLDAELFASMQAADVLIRDGDQHWRSTMRWSSLGDQLYVHSGFPTVQADAVYFGPDTYRFVRAIESFLLSHVSPPIQRAAEIGCGAGPAAIHLAIALPAAAIAALDINPHALELTRVNAALAGIHNLRTGNSDLLHGIGGMFDLIVANPPYMIDSEHRVYRDGGGDLGSGLSVAIVAAALSRLTPGGSLLLYTGAAITAAGDPFLTRVEELLRGLPAFIWRYTELDPDVYGEELLQPDYHQVERIAVVLLTVTRHPQQVKTPLLQPTD